MTVRVRFAPSPTGSLHLGNALTAVANRRFADAHGGTLTLRIDDTDAARRLEGGEAALVSDLEWLGLAWDRGPVRQSERGAVHAAAAHVAEREGGAVRDADGSLRLDGVTLVRPDGTATYQLATVADDVEMGITHIIRGSDHRPNEVLQQRIARAIGSVLPEVIHHGLLLGDDGKKLSKRAEGATVASLREEGIPAEAVHAYLEELGLPRHDVRLDLPRIRRLAIQAIEALSGEELARRSGADLQYVPVMRGARDLVEARAYAQQVAEPLPYAATDVETLARFRELASLAPRDLVRELRAAGGNLKELRLALTGRPTGPELSAILAALPKEEALRRVDQALQHAQP